MSSAAFITAALAVVASVAAVLLKQSSPHMALLLAVSVCAVVLYRLLGSFETALDYMKVLVSVSGISQKVIEPVIKSAAVVLVGSFCSSVCRDAGQSAIASMVDLSVNISCACLALPLVKLTVDTVGELL